MKLWSPRSKTVRRVALVIIGSLIFFAASSVPRTFATKLGISFPCSEPKPVCGSLFERTEYGYPLAFYTRDKFQDREFRSFNDPTAAMVNFAIMSLIAIPTVYAAEFLHGRQNAGKKT